MLFNVLQLPRDEMIPNKTDAKVLQPQPELIPPPELQGRSLSVWHTTVNDFPAGFFRDADVPSLAMYCRMYAQYCDINEQLERTGFVMETAMGAKEHPLVGTLLKMATRIHALSRSLKLCPSSRIEMAQVPKSPKKAPVMEKKVGWKPRIAGIVS